MVAAHVSVEKSPFVKLIEEHNLQPLWERFHSLASPEPQPIDHACQWRWEDMVPLVERAPREVPMEHAERRALVMANPDFGGRLITAGSLSSAIQIIEPGESAEPHRHSVAAIRFVIESEGAATFVNGHSCEMRPGDLILTPAWTWHGHVNNTDRRAVWLDGLDVPLVRFGVDAFFYEPGRDAAPPNESATPTDDNAWAEAGMVGAPLWAPLLPLPHAYSPKFRYPWDATRRFLQDLPADRDGSRLMRYVNPRTGGAIMPTIDCYVLQLAKNVETVPRRATFSTVCMVAEGEGRSTIGDRQFNWCKNDVFTIPHWRWATHVAATDNARLFLMTDRELYARLDLLREELAPDSPK